MKRKKHSRFIAIVITVCMLLACMTMSAATTATAEPLNSAVDVVTSNELLTDDELLSADEKTILRADDPIIAKDSMILHYVDSTQFDNARHTARLFELEDLNTYVFQNADGTRTVYFLDENVKYINNKGQTVEKELSLVANNQGYGIAQSDIGLTMPNDPRDGIRLNYLGHTVTITPITGNTDITATKKDNSIVYTGIFGATASLKYTPLLSGVKEDIILSSYIPNESYSFTLDTDGLYLCEKDGKYFLAESAAGKPLFYLGDVITYDAIGKPSEGTLTVQTISAGSEYTITVAADEAFLSDPTTVYPVTIDPSITISDNTHGANAIEDSPIYAGRPDKNYGTYVYNPAGTPDSTNGVGRTVVRLNGLINSSEYASLTASQISNVTFNVKEASGTSAQTVNLHPLTGNTTWTESTVTWNNIGSFTTSVNYGASMSGGQWTAFDITGLVKAWKSNTYSANAGFILKNANETNHKSFLSSEYSTTSYRPYVTMTYSPTTTTIALNYTSTSIVEGGTQILTATTSPSGKTVSWSTSNSAVAAVTASGIVIAQKAGVASITASMTDSDGITHSASCTVYVYIANGVYYFNNVSNNYRLEFPGPATYQENTKLIGWESDGTEPSGRHELFKTTYLGNGLYSIRSMLDNRMGWTRSGSDLISTTIGTTDSAVPDTAKWSIRHNGKGYCIYSYGTSRAVTCPDYVLPISQNIISPYSSVIPDRHIQLSTYSSSNLMQCWNIQKISSSYRGIDIHAKTSSMSIGNTYTFTAATYSTYVGEYALSYRWKTDNARIASVGDTTGVVTARNSGKIAVTAYLYSYPSETSAVTLTVNPATTPTAGIKSGSVYMIKNVSKGTYLTALTSNILSLASKDAMNGRQLWYVEWTGSAYKLYSMGCKATIPGSSESMLSAGTAIDSPKLRTQTTNASWTIRYYNGYYYLVNNSASYNDTSVSARSVDNYVNHFSLEDENEYARWSFEEIDTATFNNYWSGSFLEQGDTVYVKIKIDDSGSDSVYLNSIINADHFGAIDYWKGLSSHVVIYGPNDPVPSGITAFEVTYKGYSPADSDEGGRTIPNGPSGIERLYDDWSDVTIFLNTSTNGCLFGSTDAHIETVILHELGHALKLAHPKQTENLVSVTNGRGGYPGDFSVLSVMNHGDPNSWSDSICATPKWHDIINLKNKWGS